MVKICNFLFSSRANLHQILEKTYLIDILFTKRENNFKGIHIDTGAARTVGDIKHYKEYRKTVHTPNTELIPEIGYLNLLARWLPH